MHPSSSLEHDRSAQAYRVSYHTTDTQHRCGMRGLFITGKGALPPSTSPLSLRMVEGARVEAVSALRSSDASTSLLSSSATAEDAADCKFVPDPDPAAFAKGVSAV